MVVDDEPGSSTNLDSSHVVTPPSSHIDDAGPRYTLRLYNNKPGANYEYSPLRISLHPHFSFLFFFFPAPPTREKPTGRGAVLNILRTAFFCFAAIIIL